MGQFTGRVPTLYLAAFCYVNKCMALFIFAIQSIYPYCLGFLCVWYIFGGTMSMAQQAHWQHFDCSSRRCTDGSSSMALLKKSVQ